MLFPKRHRYMVGEQRYLGTSEPQMLVVLAKRCRNRYLHTQQRLRLQQQGGALMSHTLGCAAAECCGPRGLKTCSQLEITIVHERMGGSSQHRWA